MHLQAMKKSALFLATLGALLQDFVRIAQYGGVPNVLTANPAVPARTLAEFVK